MHFFRGISVLVALATLPRLALADPAATPATPAAASPAPVDKLAMFKSADELWGHFQALQKGPRSPGTTPEEREQAFKDFGNILMPLIAKNQLPVTSTPLILPAHFVLLEEKQKMHAG